MYIYETLFSKMSFLKIFIGERDVAFSSLMWRGVGTHGGRKREREKSGLSMRGLASLAYRSVTPGHTPISGTGRNSSSCIVRRRLALQRLPACFLLKNKRRCQSPPRKKDHDHNKRGPNSECYLLNNNVCVPPLFQDTPPP